MTQEYGYEGVEENGSKVVMHLVSSRGLYGAERVIINLLCAETHPRTKQFVVLLLDPARPAHDVIAAVREIGSKCEVVPCRKWIDLGALRRVRELIVSHKVDFLHCHEMKSRLYGILSSKNGRPRLLTTHHNWTFGKLSVTVLELLDAIYIRRFGHIIAVSNSVHRLLRRLGVRSEKITVIRNGIPVNMNKTAAETAQAKRMELGIGPNQLVIGCVGRLSREKGQRYLVDAVPRILEQIPETVLLLVGNGKQRRVLELRGEALGVSRQVRFLGFRRDISDIYAMMNVFVLPSLREATPMALLEAMAAGVPVIASRVGGVPDIVDSGVNGILVPPGDVSALTKAVLEILLDPEFAEMVAIRALEAVKREFAISSMVNNYRLLYESVPK